jgi:hypothetical protein
LEPLSKKSEHVFFRRRLARREMERLDSFWIRRVCGIRIDEEIAIWVKLGIGAFFQKIG